MKQRYFQIIVGLVLMCLAGITDANAQKVNIEVSTILASPNKGSIDQKLSTFANEMQSVFKYQSYQLLGTHKMGLNLKEKGSAKLPGGRLLNIIPMKIKDNRLEMALEIMKKEKRIFNTVVHLKNKTNMIVGGPKHKGGVLMFQLYNDF